MFLFFSNPNFIKSNDLNVFIMIIIYILIMVWSGDNWS